MADKEARFEFWWNLEKRKFLVEKYGTNDKDELKKKIDEDIFSDRQPNVTPDPKTQLDQAKLDYWKAKADRERALATIAEQKAIYITTFGAEPSPAAEQAMKQHAENKLKAANTNILRSDGTLKCITCGKIFQQRAYPFEQADDYRKHVRGDHNRELYTLENQTCKELANQ